MRLHVLTACTRPQNLPLLANSIEAAMCEPWEVCWHLRFDPELWHVGGQRLKNDMLDQISDGWVCFLDDDTIMHPLLLHLAARWSRHADIVAVVVAQSRADGRTLHAAEENVRVGEIDIGQVVLRRDLIGDDRLPLDYEGDGMFLSNILIGEPGVVYIDEVFSFHNKLETVAA